MEITKALIERYHSGKCTPEELAAVERWLANDDSETSFPESANLQVMEDKGWKKMAERYQLSATPEKTGFRLMQLSQFWKMVACLILVMGVILSIYLYTTEPNQQPLAYKEIKTLKGQKLSIKLADGTLVQLNSESVLRVPEQFETDSRSVTFEGEAFFKVAKDVSRPFAIRTNQTTVTVLGTRFNVRAYPAEQHTSVVVEEGRVRFSAAKQNLVLEANQQGIFTSSLKMEQHVVNVDKYLAWKDGRLVFDDEPLGDIAKTLERWYGVKMVIGNPHLATQRYSGKFVRPHLQTVLESLAFAVKFKYSQKNNVYHIYP